MSNVFWKQHDNESVAPMLPIGDTWEEILKYIEENKPKGDLSFTTQGIENIMQQMTHLDEDSRDALCLTSKVVSWVCANRELMRWVRHTRFEKLFAARLATINALKPVLYGAAYPQARFERAMVIGWDIMQSRINWGTGDWKPLEVLQYIRERPGLGQAFSWHLHWNNASFVWPHFIKKLLENDASSWPPRENLLLILNFDGTLASGELLFDFAKKTSEFNIFEQTPKIVVIAFNQRPHDRIWVKWLLVQSKSAQSNTSSIVLVARRLQLDPGGSLLEDRLAEQIAENIAVLGNIHRLDYEDEKLWVAKLYYPQHVVAMTTHDFYRVIWHYNDPGLLEAIDLNPTKNLTTEWFDGLTLYTIDPDKPLKNPLSFIWTVDNVYYARPRLFRSIGRDILKMLKNIDSSTLDTQSSNKLNHLIESFSYYE